MIFNAPHTKSEYFYERNYFFKLYNEMLSDWKLGLDEFLANTESKVCKDFNTIERINAFVEKTKTSYSIAKSNVMFNIIGYFQGKKQKEEVEEIINKVENRRGTAQKKDIRDHEGNIKRIITNMKETIEDERSYKQLLEDNALKDKSLYTKSNLYIKEIDDDTYLDFLIKYKGVNNISLSEMIQYKEVLKYFVINLTRSINKFMQLTEDKDIINFHVKGEEDMSEYVTSKVDRIKKWKLKRLETLFKYYDEMYVMIDEIINTKKTESIKKIKFDKDIMANEEEFIMDYHNDLQNASATLALIKKIQNVTDERNKTLCKKYNEKIISENN